MFDINRDAKSEKPTWVQQQYIRVKLNRLVEHSYT